MKKYNYEIGRYGESLACKFLKEKNYKIIHNNFSTKLGEIDIISLYDDTIIFTEVKSRYNSKYGLPCESVNYRKQRNIIKIAKFYIYINKLYNYNIRFDVCEIYLNNSDEDYKINYIENAF